VLRRRHHPGARDSYHEASAKDGWQRTLAFLEAHLA
jgi:dienelactone hydrolase